jgi:hypothetical protein
MRLVSVASGPLTRSLGWEKGIPNHSAHLARSYHGALDKIVGAGLYDPPAGSGP